jgi:hypothetical protein
MADMLRLGRIGATTLLAILVGACATTAGSSARSNRVPPDRLLAFQEISPERNATIVVTRDGGSQPSGCYLSFVLNGIHAARFDVGETATFYVTPGETLLLRNGPDLEGGGPCGIGKEYWTQRETVLQAGEIKRFQLSLDASGKADIQRLDP